MKRVSIAGLLGFVAVVAIGLAALVNSTRFWAGLTSLLMIGCLLGGLLGVILRGRRDGSWVGFTLFGWGYLFLSFIVNTDRDGDLLRDHNALCFVVSEWVFDAANPEPSRAMADEREQWLDRARYAERIGHHFFVILFAQVGGAFGGYLSGRRASVPTVAPSH